MAVLKNAIRHYARVPDLLEAGYEGVLIDSPVLKGMPEIKNEGDGKTENN